jgi:hypothetical protein
LPGCCQTGKGKGSLATKPVVVNVAGSVSVTTLASGSTSGAALPANGFERVERWIGADVAGLPPLATGSAKFFVAARASAAATTSRVPVVSDVAAVSHRPGQKVAVVVSSKAMAPSAAP